MKIAHIRRAACLVMATAMTGLSSIAAACPALDFLTRDDFAEADIVFEGRAVALHPTLTQYERDGKSLERAVGMEITFAVDDVIRGEWKEQRIKLGWVNGTFGYPRNFAEFEERYGTDLRVGVLSAASLKDDCSRRVVKSNTEEGIIYDTVQIKCSDRYTGNLYSDPQYGTADLSGFILNGYCTGPYMLPVSSLRDDPRRDLSLRQIGDEGFYLENHKELSVIMRDVIKAYPDQASKYETDEKAQSFILDKILSAANVDQTRSGYEYDLFIKELKLQYNSVYKIYLERQKD